MMKYMVSALLLVLVAPLYADEAEDQSAKIAEMLGGIVKREPTHRVSPSWR